MTKCRTPEDRLLNPAKTAFVDSEDLLNRFSGELSIGGGGVNQVNVHLFVLTMPFGGV
jgi:hypothetical protein